MIAHLRGTLFVKKPNHVVVDVSGCGYKLFIPLSTYYELPDEGSAVSFKVHTHVREDTLALYGFSTELEEELFQKLIAVAGVGPALALKVLSGLEVQDLVEALRRSDLVRLSSIPGVGKKTAERLVVELKDKVGKLAARTAGQSSKDRPPDSGSETRDDLLSALINLGYNRASAEKAAGAVLAQDSQLSFEQALKQVLKRIAG